MAVLTPILGAIFLRNIGRGVETKDGGGDDGGAGREIGVGDGTIGSETGGGGGG